MSDDWFDGYAAGDFLPGPGFPPQWTDPVVVDLTDRAYRLGHDDGAKTAQDKWWDGYSKALVDLAESMLSKSRRRPRHRVRHLTHPGGRVAVTR